MIPWYHDYYSVFIMWNNGSCFNRTNLFEDVSCVRRCTSLCQFFSRTFGRNNKECELGIVDTVCFVYQLDNMISRFRLSSSGLLGSCKLNATFFTERSIMPQHPNRSSCLPTMHSYIDTGPNVEVDFSFLVTIRIVFAQPFPHPNSQPRNFGLALIIHYH